MRRIYRLKMLKQMETLLLNFSQRNHKLILLKLVQEIKKRDYLNLHLRHRKLLKWALLITQEAWEAIVVKIKKLRILVIEIKTAEDKKWCMDRAHLVQMLQIFHTVEFMEDLKLVRFNRLLSMTQETISFCLLNSLNKLEQLES